jgi:putative transposase
MRSGSIPAATLRLEVSCVRHRLFYHLVWTTRGRAPMIDALVARYLSDALPAIALTQRTRTLEIGIVATHVHMLVRCHPTTNLSRLMQMLKGTTSHGVSAGRLGAAGSLRWDRGYHITTVSERALERVADYVATQSQHHPTEAIPDWSPGRFSALAAEPRL